MAHENVIEMREITKIFGEFVANDKINLELRKGEIHALLGENGAGKSTLMNMLAGLLEPTSGEIVVNGKSEKLDSPSKGCFSRDRDGSPALHVGRSFHCCRKYHSW